MAVVLSGLACGGPELMATPTSAVAPGFNLLIVVDSEVQLKRERWSDYHSATFGTVLYRGDQLRLSEGASALVLCDNLTLWVVPPGAPSGLSNGCSSSSEPALRSSGGLIGNTRGGADPLIPYIIGPRATKLLSPTPTLHWNSVPGAKSYSVRITGVDWNDAVSANEMIYPGNPPLQAGTTYLLVVEADNGTSSRDEGLPELGFTLLPEEEAGRVRADAATIAGLSLSNESKAFAVAQLYAGHGLYAEAIEVLEEMTTGSQVANVYRALGDLYRQVGLSLLAEERYLKAVMLAEDAGDAEALATAQAGLGEVYVTLGRKDEAVRWFEKAKADYETLGDEQHASQVTERLAELNP